MVQIELTPEEISFLNECCRYSKKEYVERSSKYIFNDDIPNYNETIYKPKIKQFDEMIMKMRY